MRGISCLAEEGLCSLDLFRSSSELFLINVNVAERGVDDDVRMEKCLLSPSWWDWASRKYDKGLWPMEAPNFDFT
jgi:hypothetical protein